MHTLKDFIKQIEARSLPVVAVWLIITFQAPTAGVWALSAQDSIASFEQRLFFRNYSEDELSARLNRVEKEVFGQIFTDSVDDRINRIATALPGKGTQATSPAQAPLNRSENGVSSRNRETDSNSEDAAELKKREHFASLAARDDEIAKLMAEGISLWRAKNGPAAIDKFRQVVRLDPQNAQGYYSLGVALEAKSDFREAKACYEKAAALQPDNKEYVQTIRNFEKHSAAQEKLIADEKIGIAWLPMPSNHIGQDNISPPLISTSN